MHGTKECVLEFFAWQLWYLQLLFCIFICYRNLSYFPICLGIHFTMHSLWYLNEQRAICNFIRLVGFIMILFCYSWISKFSKKYLPVCGSSISWENVNLWEQAWCDVEFDAWVEVLDVVETYWDCQYCVYMYFDIDTPMGT